MRETLEATGSDWPSETENRDEEEITMPMRIVCGQAGAPRNARAHWIKKKGESAPRRIPDWTEIGEPS